MYDSIAYDKNFTADKVKKYIKKKPDAMIAKGIATIQLFDKNNKLTREIKSENIITDLMMRQAYANLLYRITEKNSQISTQPFAAIVLSAYDGPEDKDAILKGLITGYATKDGSYDSSNTSIGYFNKTESKIFRESRSSVFGNLRARFRWHMVFNFPEIAANGTFQTIYFTEPFENSINPAYCTDSANLDFYPGNHIAEIDTNKEINFYGDYAFQAWDYDGDSFIFFPKMSYTSVTNFSFSLFVANMKNKKLTKYSVDNTWYTSNKETDTLLDTMFNLMNTYRNSNHTAIKYDRINNIAYVKAVNPSWNKDTATRIIKIDLNNKKLTLFDVSTTFKSLSKTKVLYSAANPSNTEANFYVRDGFLYYVNCTSDTDSNGYITNIAYTILKFNNQGVCVKSNMHVLERNQLKDGSSLDQVYYTFLPNLIGMYVSIAKYTVFFDYDCKLVNTCEQLGSCAGDYFIPGLNCYKKFRSNYTAGTYVDCSCFSAVKVTSQNRLPAPVEKTSANSMKIQYDLTYDYIVSDIAIPDWDEL